MIYPRFQGVNILYFIIFKWHTSNRKQKIFSSKFKNKRLQFYDLWINLFNQPVKSDVRTYDSILKTATGQGDDFIADCLLDYPYFKNHYKMIAIDLRKQ